VTFYRVEKETDRRRRGKQMKRGRQAGKPSDDEGRAHLNLVTRLVTQEGENDVTAMRKKGC